MLIPFGVFSAGGAGGGGGGAASYELISSAYGTGSSGTITFSSIPSTYKHLQVRYVARTSAGSYSSSLYVTLNGASSGYSWHKLFGDGSSVSSNQGSGDSSWTTANAIPGDAVGANEHGAGILDILDYASTTTNKTGRMLAGIENPNVKRIFLASGGYYSTSAVSSITFTMSGGSFKTSTRFSLYGIKGA